MTQWIAPESPLQLPVMRVSDADREHAAERLREHWLAGRLDSAELDERSTELWSARTNHELAHALRELPEPAPVHTPAEGDGTGSSTIASLILGAVGLALLLVSFGFLSLLVLPLSVTAWGLGRSARRRADARGRDQATAGMVLGIVGTVVSMLFLTGYAVVLL